MIELKICLVIENCFVFHFLKAIFRGNFQKPKPGLKFSMFSFAG